ncbi:hypothetical protein [Agreia sp.]|uniref:hypothetical protein n=1 Tax=Agreia sp. TaxID=1872416 RepID=UPI0035BC3975
MLKPRLVALGLIFGLALAGCSSMSGGVELDDNTRPGIEPYEPAEEPGYVPDDSEIPQPEIIWSCDYSPTMNEDWHDDVLCIRGGDQDRPYLREGDDFITEDEIMESAREYENALNGF